MTGVRKDVTAAELAVLEALWECGKATIRQLTETLYPGGGASHYATVKKLLERLQGKQCVRRHRESTPHVFEAAIGRDVLLGRRLQAVADSLCGGERMPLIMHLLQSGRLTKKQRRELHAFLDDLIRANSDSPHRGGE